MQSYIIKRFVAYSLIGAACATLAGNSLQALIAALLLTFGLLVIEDMIIQEIKRRNNA